MNKNAQAIIHELKHHLPFTATATLIAVLISLILIKIPNFNSELTFGILHPIHILASAIVTSALFYCYKKNFFQAILIGVIGSIIIGSFSDIIFPWLGGTIFQFHPHFHLPIIEKPILILSASILGGIIGVSTKITKLPHFVHVFLSVFASLFYLLTFSTTINIGYFIIAFIIIFIAVIIPCCLSDIILPFIFIKERIKHCNCRTC
jgi:hypothetical protein